MMDRIRNIEIMRGIALYICLSPFRNKIPNIKFQMTNNNQISILKFSNQSHPFKGCKPLKGWLYNRLEIITDRFIAPLDFIRNVADILEHFIQLRTYKQSSSDKFLRDLKLSMENSADWENRDNAASPGTSHVDIDKPFHFSR